MFNAKGFYLVCVLFISFQFACGGEKENDVIPQNQEVKNSVTITQGIFGITTSQDDIGEHPKEILKDFKIEVFSEQPSTKLKEQAKILAQTNSNDRGFYEISLPNGNFWVCTSFRRCIEVKISDKSLVRLDYEYSAGPGWSLPIVQPK